MRKKVLIRGPALVRSGYSVHTRFLLRALRKHEDRFDIYLINVGWGQCSWLYEDNDERRWIDFIIQKTALYLQQGGQFDISIQVTIPKEFERLAPYNIGVTAGIETTKISPDWVEKSNMMDKIITISEFSKFGFDNTTYQAQNNVTGEIIDDFRVTTPVEIVHYPAVQHEPGEIDLDLKCDFNFLVDAQWGPRKNVENTVRWFVEEFHEDDNVGLLLKVNRSGQSIPDRFETKALLKRLLARYPERKCTVQLLHGDLTDEELTAVYVHDRVKAMVSLSHGEGHGLGMYSAAINELPIITVGWSGHRDYLYWPEIKKRRVKGKLKEFETKRKMPLFTEVDYTIQPIQPEAVWPGVLEKDSMWSFAIEGSYKKQMRFVYENYDLAVKKAKRLGPLVRETFEPEKQYDIFANAIWEKTDEEQEWNENLNLIEVV